MAEGQVIAIHSLEELSIQVEEANSSKKLIVVDFTATWCEPCRVIVPVFADLARRHPHLIFLKVDIDELKRESGGGERWWEEELMRMEEFEEKS